MPNSWFQFKQFRVQQDRCAMKVSTDACIQGAWAAIQFPGKASQRVLDIGTGTGLLSLMLAQTLPDAHIDAIELNMEACAQAAGNFALSPWADRLKATPTALADFIEVATPSYDLIICNPPFFHNQLQAAQTARNDARHSVALDKETLAAAIAQLLSPEGYCCVMYPEREWLDWRHTATAHQLCAEKILEVQPGATAAVNRVIGIFRRQETSRTGMEKLIIYQENKQYTDGFRQLLAPYYLHL